MFSNVKEGLSFSFWFSFSIFFLFFILPLLVLSLLKKVVFKDISFSFSFFIKPPKFLFLFTIIFGENILGENKSTFEIFLGLLNFISSNLFERGI